MEEKKKPEEVGLKTDHEKDDISRKASIKTVDTDKMIEEESFTEKWKNHRLLFVRGTYIVLNSIWMVVMAVGMFLAWLIALLAT